MKQTSKGELRVMKNNYKLVKYIGIYTYTVTTFCNLFM